MQRMNALNRRGRRRSLTLLAWSLAAIALSAFGPACAARMTTGAAAGQQATQPLDPLNAGERTTAEKLARSDERVQKLLPATAELVSVEFLALKGGERDTAERHADLLFARAERDYGVRVIVRLGADPSVAEVQRISANSIPITRADVDQAWRVALSDKAYVTQLGRNPAELRVEALRMYSEDPSDPCSSGRCLYLMIRDGGFYVPGAAVIVDLATQRLLPARRPQ
jgi:hypothetical protein